MGGPRGEHVVARLAWDEIAHRLAQGAAGILPVGAGAKEHGFHLPMGTDQVQAEWLAARLAEAIPALIWPTLTYGFYPAFVDYAGSCSLSAATFRAIVAEIAGAMLGYGARPVLVLNTGISTIGPIDAAIGLLGATAPVRHLRIHDGPRYRAAATRLAEQRHGSHADELETSRMLVLAPEQVTMARAEASPLRDRSAPGPLTPHDPSTPNYSRSGSYGDPTLASRNKGETLLAAMVEDLVEMARHAIEETNRGR